MEYCLFGGLMLIALRKSTTAKHQMSLLYRKLHLEKYLHPFKQAYIKANEAREIGINKKNLSENAFKDKIEALKKFELEVFSFDEYEKLGNVEFYTDNQVLQGDTFAELSFNSRDKALRIEGNFEIVNKNLVENNFMFVRVDLKNLPLLEFYTNLPNVIRIKAKTNGYLIRLVIDVSRRFNSMLPYQAHIIDDSNEFQTYEIPLKNLRLERSFNDRTVGRLNFGILEISRISMQIESNKEGPFSVEIQSMELAYDKKYDSDYEKYHLPIFLRV